MKPIVLVHYLASPVSLVMFAGLLFGSAGRWDLPFFWAYLGVMAVPILASMLVTDPSLTQERLHPGPGAHFYWSDWLLPVPWLAQFVIAGLDLGRFHWNDHVPLPIQIAALVAVLAAMVLLVWVVAVNRFFSTAVRIQTERGHHVITSGPYGIVRHPGYALCLFVFGPGGLALGSWLAALVGLLSLFPIVRRTVGEDRFLKERLEGYATYCQKVRYRLVPGVW